MDPGAAIERMSDATDPEGHVFLEGKMWAQIAAETVCPECLTSTEERELALSYIELVEAEIARLQDRGADPHPLEAPLVAYALTLRSRLASSDDAYPPPPPE